MREREDVLVLEVGEDIQEVGREAVDIGEGVMAGEIEEKAGARVMGMLKEMTGMDIQEDQEEVSAGLDEDMGDKLNQR